MTPAEFIAKWERVTGKESAFDREHFIDICRLIGHDTPAEGDPDGVDFTFQRGLKKVTGGQGYADVWKRGYFAWEYKDKRFKDLNQAYVQLAAYADALENPPLLVVCDLDRFEIHTHFTNCPTDVVNFRTRDLDRPETLEILRNVFRDPDALRPGRVSETLTTKASERIGAFAEMMRSRGIDAERAAHFLMQCVFCMFAEDIGLLPDTLFKSILQSCQSKPDLFAEYSEQLFRTMATGGHVLLKEIPYFNGGLFDRVDIPTPVYGDVHVLHQLCQFDWKQVEPAIFGTLFEGCINTARRKQLGAHYTSRDDILLVVEPVVMAPWRAEWEALRDAREGPLTPNSGGTQAEALASNPGLPHRDGVYEPTRLEGGGTELQAFVDRLGEFRILDPACGSGNFLYVALFQMLDLEKEVRDYAFSHNLPVVQPRVGPHQLMGIEIDPYAHQLAQLVVWIGYLQWKHFHGEPHSEPPILKPLHTVRRMDAILTDDGCIPEWPETDVIIGNPPFLGGKRIRADLGDDYVGSLFKAYQGRVPPEADLVCYWHERAREEIEAGRAKRAGLLATNSIRGGKNRAVLQRIKETGDIFMAWSDRPWVLNGAAVRISIVGFDDGVQKDRVLDGVPVAAINPDLTAAVDITAAKRLAENAGISFMGVTPAGPFDISAEEATAMLNAPLNVNGRPNVDVIRPVANAKDIVQRNRGRYIIDFGPFASEQEAAVYEVPFEHLRKYAKPVRALNNREAYRDYWWRFAEAREGMRAALIGLKRYIATPRVAKHRVFVWLPAGTLADSATFVFARDDDYTFGVLHSHAHEVWALRMGTSLEDRPRYTPTTCFETFAFPRPTDMQRDAIAEAARALDAARHEALHNDPKLTLTALYNKRPTWLDNLHKSLDRAVYDAYGWTDTPTDDQILARLLALNVERAGETMKCER